MVPSQSQQRRHDSRTEGEVGERRSPSWLFPVGLGLAAALVGILALTGSPSGDLRPQRRAGDGSATDAGKTKRVLVEPFRSATGRDDDPLVRGLADGLVRLLRSAQGLDVVVPDKDAFGERSTGDLVAELAIDYVFRATVEGSVDQPDRAPVRVTVELFDVAAGAVDWNQTSESPFTDVFALQSDLVVLALREMAHSVGPATWERIERVPTTSLEAYRAYLRGSSLCGAEAADLPPQGCEEESLRLLSRAAELDPEFAEPRGRMATLHLRLARAADGSHQRHLQEALRLAERSTELDPSDRDGFRLLGEIHLAAGRPADAEVAFGDAERRP